MQSLLKSNKEAAALTNGRKASKDQEEDEVKEVVQVIKEEQNMNKDMRYRWSRNMLLLGDGHWQALREASDDLGRQMSTLEREWSLKVVSRSGETLDRMYDRQRGKVLFALPRGVEKVAISVGSKDLQDPGLLTLKDNSLDVVRKSNAQKLNEKVDSLICIIRYAALTSFP